MGHYGSSYKFRVVTLLTYIEEFPKAIRGLVPIGYRGALLSTLLQVNVYVTHNLLNVPVQWDSKE
jgi:hypothetical protein